MRIGCGVTTWVNCTKGYGGNLYLSKRERGERPMIAFCLPFPSVLAFSINWLTVVNKAGLTIALPRLSATCVCEFGECVCVCLHYDPQMRSHRTYLSLFPSSLCPALHKLHARTGAFSQPPLPPSASADAVIHTSAGRCFFAWPGCNDRIKHHLIRRANWTSD